MQLNETMENLHEINVLQIIFQTDMQKYCRNSSILSPEANPKAICFGRFHEIVDMTGEFQIWPWLMIYGYVYVRMLYLRILFSFWH